MRVLHFFKTYWPDTFGGIERTIHAIATGTKDMGIETDVLSLSRKPAENSLVFDGHRADKAKLDFEFASTGFSREAFGKFRQLSQKADIVHYHFPWPFMDAVHLIAPPGKPTVVTYHSDIVKQKALLQLYRPLMHRFLSRVDRIVATSPNYLKTSEVLASYRDKTDVIPLGLEDKAGDDGLHGQQPVVKGVGDTFFLFVGVLRYYKGVHVLLEAADKVAADIVIVGDGFLEQELKQKAQALNLRNVHFLGALPDGEKTELLKACTAFVFPSQLRSEAFGLSLVEASMFGKPMISCEIGTGTSYVNLDEVTGLVVPPNDPAALAQAMNRILADKQERQRFGMAARARYEQNFTLAQMAKRYAALYESLIRKDR